MYIISYIVLFSAYFPLNFGLVWRVIVMIYEYADRPRGRYVLLHYI